MKIIMLLAVMMLGASTPSYAQTFRTVDIQTRPGVQQRFLYSTSDTARAVVVLFAGGHGGLQISPAGDMRWGEGNFLVRTRGLFAEQGLAVIVIDAPSDRQGGGFLNGFRQTEEHVRDVAAVIAWAKENARLPVWLVGTSRGTQSAAWIATRLTPDTGPAGVVLTSTILDDPRSRPVPAMDLGRLAIPVLVVHHEQDGCSHCLFRDVPRLMEKLPSRVRKELVSFTGGRNVGDPCEARAFHGFNGLEADVVKRIGTWILTPAL